MTQVSTKPYFLEELPFEGEVKGVILCAHGLNQQPDALKTLLHDLAEVGMKSYLFHLPGHFGEEDFRHLTAKTYFENHEKVYQYLVERHGPDIHFVGYSFGGLIGVHHFDLCPFRKMVLIAPALKMHGYTSLLKPFLPFLNRVSSISFGNCEFERQYRYHEKGVPAEVYKSFFQVYSQNKFKDKSKVKQAGALLFIHPRDELVSHWKLKRWVSKKTNWQFHSLENKKAEFRRYNHLCFDPNTLGEESYQSFVEEIKSYLQN